MVRQLLIASLACLFLWPSPAAAGVTDAEWKTVNREFQTKWSKEEKVDAVETLAKCDDVRAVKQLWTVLTKYKESGEVNRAIGDALAGAKDEKSIDYLVSEVTKPMAPEKRALVCDAIAQIKNDKIIGALKKLLSKDDPMTKTAAIDALGIMKETSAVPQLVAALSDKAWQVRYAAIVALVRIEDKRAVPAFIERMEKEPGRLEGDFQKALMALTGQKKDGALEWRSWWKTNSDKDLEGGGYQDFRSYDQTGTTDPNSGNEESKGSVPTYYGIKIYSRRIVFVIDTSDSMNTKWKGKKPKQPRQTVEITGTSIRGDDKDKRKATLDWTKVKTKWDLAREQLIFTLRQLDKKTQFTIITYNARVKVWKPKLIAATPSNVKSAVIMLRKTRPRDATNIYEALKKSFTLSSGDGPENQVLELSQSNYKGGGDTIFFLTDGWPTVGKVYWRRPGGKRTNEKWMEQMMDAVKKWNRLRKVKIHTIGIGNHCKELMGELAEEFGGDYVIPGEDNE